jgi:CDP-paratose 2-epimerase
MTSRQQGNGPVQPPAEGRPVLILGGAGFIGTNLSAALVESGLRVRVFDNLSRRGVPRNLAWLQREHGDRIEFVEADVRDREAVLRATADAAAVFHLAAQVAVTTSLEEPWEDFAINAGGTLAVLEGVRAAGGQAPVIYTSTNKVYGDLSHCRLEDTGTRYQPVDPALARAGVSEAMPLSFHSPYGCSKGAADQYVLDYGRVFGLKTVVFRMSCIYGPHQFGTEDQGWVAHFVKSALRDEPLFIYGDGKQVRDLLYVQDLVNALTLAWSRAAQLSGQAFNIGGTPANSVSLLELLGLLEQIGGRRLRVEFAPWRVGDQRYYTSDVSAFARQTGWYPRTGVATGLRHLYDWLAREEEQTAGGQPAAAVDGIGSGRDIAANGVAPAQWARVS